MNPNLEKYKKIFSTKLKRINSLEKGEVESYIRKKAWDYLIRRKISKKSEFNIKEIIAHYEKIIVKRAVFNDENFFFDKDEEAQIKEVFRKELDSERKRIVNKADRILSGKYQIFDKEILFKHNINWHFDPITQKDWERIFYKDIIYQGNKKLSDVKYVWELNRHHHMVTLAQAYFLTSNKIYSSEVVRQIKSWIKQNPPFIGVNWVSELEISIRLINWVWAIHLIRATISDSKKFLCELLAAVQLQCKQIYNNLSIGYYANNHLIGEASGLAIAGIYFKQIIGAKSFYMKGCEILKNEILKQTYRDGGGVEQAPSYLRFIIEFFLLGFILASKNNIKLSDEINARLKKSIDFLAYTIKPGCNSPNFGDADEGRSVDLCGDEIWNLRGIINVGAELYNDPELKFIARGLTGHVVWLRGAKGFQKFNSLKDKEPEIKDVVFKNSGYAIIRENWKNNANYLVMDCGLMGYRTCAHGHADALSVQVEGSGEAILVDPGTYAYNKETKYRNYFRSTKAHNTVTVDGKGQAEIEDRMAWQNTVNASLNYSFFHEQFAVLSGYHNGYQRLKQPVLHKRYVLCWRKPLYYVIIDQMKSFETHKYTSYYHLHPKSETKLSRSNIKIFTKKNEWRLIIKTPKPNDINIVKGEDSPMGWFSDKYGKKEASPVITSSFIDDGTVWIITLLWKHNESMAEDIFCLNEKNNKSIYFSVNTGNETQNWFVSDDEKRTELNLDDIKVEGKIACIEKKSNELCRIFGVDLRCIEYKENKLFVSDKPMSGLIKIN